MIVFLRNIVATASLVSMFSVANAFIPLHHKQYVSMSQQILTRYTSAPHNSLIKVIRCSSALFGALPTKETGDKKELTPAIISEMIEVSFIQSCLQLASGYVDVLKLFIVAVKAGYEANLTLDELEKLVEKCPINSANRELMKEEKELRREWMLVVYEMLNRLKSNDSTQLGEDQDNSVVQARVYQVVSSILSIQRQLAVEEEQSGGKKDAKTVLASLSVSDVFSRSDALSQMNETFTSAMEKAFLKNDVTVGLLTCKVLEEERLCNEGSSGNSRVVSQEKVPRPPIPGTS